MNLDLNGLFGVQIEFDVIQIPKTYTPLNDDLYISGTFNNWIPNDPRYKLTHLPSGLFKISIDLVLGAHEYKFTRGSWNTSETNSDGTPKPNRQLQVISLSTQRYLISIANWSDMKKSSTAQGNVHILDSKFPYPQFNTLKRIWIYLPSDYYTSLKNYSVIYMHDAQNLFDSYYSFAGEWGVDETMEQFFIQNKQSSIVVGLETTFERMSELTPFSNPQYGGGKGDLYLDFIVNNVKSYIDARFRTKSDRENTGIAGSSLGGLLSFYGGLKRQDIFGKVGVFSPSFWFSDKIYNFAAETPNTFQNLRIYFVCGSQESSSMSSDMMKMINQLKSSGYKNIDYKIKADGQHSEWFWRREFPDAYQWLFLN